MLRTRVRNSYERSELEFLTLTTEGRKGLALDLEGGRIYPDDQREEGLNPKERSDEGSSNHKMKSLKSNTSWYLYILKCRDDSFYCGITNNLEERLQEHNNGEGAKYTKTRLPVKLIYFEEHPDKSSACKREIEVKGWRREKKEKLTADFPHLQ